MKQVRVEYEDSWMDIEVPDSAAVVRSGETFTEPKPLEDLVEATRRNDTLQLIQSFSRLWSGQSETPFRTMVS